MYVSWLACFPYCLAQISGLTAHTNAEALILSLSLILTNSLAVRTMLEAIISFFPSEGGGAIGALEWTREERQRLAREVGIVNLFSH